MATGWLLHKQQKTSSSRDGSMRWGSGWVFSKLLMMFSIEVHWIMCRYLKIISCQLEHCCPVCLSMQRESLMSQSPADAVGTFSLWVNGFITIFWCAVDTLRKIVLEPVPLVRMCCGLCLYENQLHPHHFLWLLWMAVQQWIWRLPSTLVWIPNDAFHQKSFAVFCLRGR